MENGYNHGAPVSSPILPHMTPDLQDYTDGLGGLETRVGSDSPSSSHFRAI